ncbi:Sensor protein CzcS [Pandoraea pnomenusa]|jgi:two-component system heavy metal sensor histidine kinase CusS|uniref:Sensor protein n=1 Tax=Pandoraea pnomenusa TaxID=93220 RepID=A0A378YB72_9BURK|nr:two-component sensor histidine kinase [Pandoraea pnomenusa]SUA74482.1 Sensor kinase CusS [Pandoraea pnomenusa]VVE63047.1 Sensor protein CzcS [Pandoraea pnomenusa]
MVKHSISRRLAAMFAVVALSVFALVGAALDVMLRVQLERHLRESLDDRAQIAHIIVYHGSTPEKWQLVREKLSDMTPRDGTTTYAVTSDDPNYTYGTPVIGMFVKRLSNGYVRLRPDEGDDDMLTTREILPPYGTRPAVTLQVAASYSPNERTLRAFGLGLAALSALGSLAVLILSYSVTRLGLAPLTRLTREASEIRPDNRSQRLDTRSLPVELNDLAHSFNGALARLDSAYERLESFNADVAHELRTPVTILIGQTEVALTRERPVEDLRVLLQSNLEELGRMRTIINDMLFLSRADQGERATGLTGLSLASEAAHTLEFLEIPLEEARVTARLHGAAFAQVNKALFGRALANLVMNAVEHCAPGANIDVHITPLAAGTEDAGQVRIEVVNPGAPIPREVLRHLFDRFFRAEPSRTNSRENHGLGLAIVKAIAEMHGGTVWARSADGLNTFGFSIATGRGTGRPAGDLPLFSQGHESAGVPAPVARQTP